MFGNLTKPIKIIKITKLHFHVNFHGLNLINNNVLFYFF